MANATDTKRNAALAVTFHADGGGECAIDENPAFMQIRFGDGTMLHLDRAELNKVWTTCAWHGAKQKLVDAAALSRNPDTGRSASVEDKAEAVRAVAERMIEGFWRAARGEGGAGSGGLLFRALCRMYAGKKDEAAIREYLAGKSDVEQAALRKNSRVAAVIEEIKAEDAARKGGAGAGSDSDAMLGELDGE